jgi:hypothetical protein
MKRLREEIRGLADDANEKTQFARDWRNRRLAHIELSVGDIAKPLASATLDQVEVLWPQSAALSTFSRNSIWALLYRTKILFQHWVAWTLYLQLLIEVSTRAISNVKSNLGNI